MSPVHPDKQAFIFQKASPNRLSRHGLHSSTVLVKSKTVSFIHTGFAETIAIPSVPFIIQAFFQGGVPDF